MTRRAPGTPPSAATAGPVRNDPPEFASQHHDREVGENSGAGAPVGPPLTADRPQRQHGLLHDLGKRPLQHRKRRRPDSSGQRGQPGPRAVTAPTVVTITATDSHGDSGQASVTISIVNVDEPGISPPDPRHPAGRRRRDRSNHGPGRQRGQRDLAVEQRRWSHQRRHRQQLHGQAGRRRPHPDGRRPVRGRPRPGQVRRGQHGLPGRQRRAGVQPSGHEPRRR